MNLSSARRLVVVAPWFQGGGAQAALVESLGLINAAEVVVIVCFRGNRNTDAVEDAVSKIHFLNEARTPLGVWRASKAVVRLLLPGDVLYSLMRGSHVVLGLVRTHRLRQHRLVASFHQLPSVDAAGRVSAIENFLVRRSLRWSRLVTTPSQRALAELRAAGLLSGEQGVVSPNPIRQAAVPPRPPRSRPLKPIRLLFAGRLDEQKGVDLIGELLEGSQTPVHLVVAGEGPMAPTVQDLKARPWQHTVEYLGHVSDIFEFIDDADFLFLPSRFELNPVIVWEAWARGRAVISSRAVAFDDLALQGPIVQYSDAKQLQALLVALAREPDSYFESALAASARTSQDSPLIRGLDEAINDA
jgi:glycosyltransferase involved in cell wall biosynthesis